MSNIKKEITLSACPFCGGEAEWRKPNYYIGNIFCKDCGIGTLTLPISEAIKAWNKRPSLSVEEIEEAVKQWIDKLPTRDGYYYLSRDYDSPVLARAIKDKIGDKI